MNKKKMIKMMIQMGFAVLFFVLLATDNLRGWLAIFIIGVLVTPLFGRIYCGWLCPIHTGTMLVTMSKKKKNRKPAPVPKLFKAAWIRYGMAVLLVAVFLAGELAGRRIPALMILFVIGLALTYFYQESFLHRYLCPYGAILKLAAFRTRRAVTINPERCQNHGMCEKVCPAEAIDKVDGRNQIDPSDCLVCLRCAMNCPERAIHY